MADLRDITIGRLSTTAGVDMKTNDANTVLYTVPTGKACILSHVIVRNPTATLVGGDLYDFGDVSSDCDSWLQNVALASMTLTSHYFIIESNNTAYVTLDAGDEFGIRPEDGSDGVATATIEVFGYLYDV